MNAQPPALMLASHVDCIRCTGPQDVSANSSQSAWRKQVAIFSAHSVQPVGTRLREQTSAGTVRQHANSAFLNNFAWYAQSAISSRTSPALVAAETGSKQQQSNVTTAITRIQMAAARSVSSRMDFCARKIQIRKAPALQKHHQYQ